VIYNSPAMLDRRGRYQNISIAKPQFPELKEAKLRYQAMVGRDVTWGDFFVFMVSQVFPPGGEDVQYAEMGQWEPLSEAELAERGWVRDDAMSVQVAQSWRPWGGEAVGGLVGLSDASCELIATKLAEKLRT